MSDELVGRWDKLVEENKALKSKVYQHCIGTITCLETLESLIEKETKNQEILALLNNIRYKVEYLKGYGS